MCYLYGCVSTLPLVSVCLSVKQEVYGKLYVLCSGHVAAFGGGGRAKNGAF